MENSIKSGIYGIINENSGKMYIGSSGDIGRRIKTHQADLRAGRHCNKELQEDYNNGQNLIYKTLKEIPVNLRAELLNQEATAIDQAKSEGKELYNIEEVYHDHYISEYKLKDKIVDLYCMEHFGSHYEALVYGIPAKREQLNELLDAKTEEEKNRIKEKYKDVIDYQNKKRSYGFLYGLNYDDMLKLPEEERKKKIREAKERKNWKR